MLWIIPYIGFVAELTKTIDGRAVPAGKFAYVGDPKDISTWHLPLDTKDHIESALHLFGHEKHVPQSEMQATARKIASAAKDAGFDTANFCKKYLHSDHSEKPSPWIEIFRAGDYRPQGKGVITRDDLQRVVRNYDPSFHEAPVCVGHPKDNMPAYGWVDRLMLDGDALFAKEKQVDTNFDEARKAGRYKKRSASFYTDAAGNVTALRHVGWLGAQPPEVKGLQDVQFSDGDRKFIEVSFGEEESVETNVEKTVDDRIKAFFSNLFSGSKKDVSFDEDSVKRIVGDAVTAATAPLQAKITTLETQLGDQSKSFSERETKFAQAEVGQRKADAIARLKTAGRWIPAYEKMGLPLVFDELAKNTKTVEFGEGDKKQEVTPLDLFVDFLEGLPKIVPDGIVFSEGARRTMAGSKKDDPLTEAARARQKEKNISFSEALDQVASEHPELTRNPGTGAAGSV